MSKRVFFAFLSSAGLAFANPMTTVVDRHFSPATGAENFLTIQKEMEFLEDRFFRTPSSQFSNFQDPSKIASFDWDNMSRLGMLLIWYPTSLAMSVTQHEVFGHGYRIRDLGPKYAKVSAYKMRLIDGATNFEFSDKLSAPQMLTIDIAGLEAEGIMIERIRLDWLKNKSIDTRQIMLYFGSSMSQLNYVATVDETPTSYPDTGNDIESYLFLVNTIYKKGTVNKENIKALSLLNLLDPFTFYSIVSSLDLSTYKHSIPMIPLGSVKYLPAVRMNLTPFGLQGVLHNFFSHDFGVTHAALKWGKNGPLTYYGLGVENQDLLSWRYGTMGLRFDVWHQPEVFFNVGAMNMVDIMQAEGPIPELYSEDALNQKSFGALASVIGTVGKQDWPLNLFYELGFKTKGYLAGEALRQAPIARLGLSGDF